MSNRRKTTPSASPKRKPQFPLELLPPEIAAMARAVARSEKTTVSQASIAALIAVSDSLGNAAEALADSLDLDLPPVDIEFLVPDPADRPAVRRAYAALVRTMPPDARQRAASTQAVRETAAGNMKVISRREAVDRIAAHYRGRDAYLVAAGPQQAAGALEALAPVAGCTAYLDQGDSETVMTVTGPALQVMPDVMDAGQAPVAAVVAIPKTVPARRLSRVLANDIPADGSRDMIMLTTDDGRHMAYPLILVEAIEQSDQKTGMQIRASERDLIAAGLPPAAVAMLDQADAAGAHGARLLEAVAGATDGCVLRSPVPQAVRDIAAGLFERAAAGGLGLCPHLLPGAPVPAFWLPYAPGQIRCVSCNAEAGRGLAGTAEDRTCDRCRRVSDQIFSGAAQLPPVVASLPGLVAAAGPVTIMYGLCPDCHAEAYPETDGGS
jgi:hypothetical protein